MARKTRIPNVAVPVPMKINGKKVETVIPEEKPQPRQKIDITAAQLLKPMPENAEHVLLSELFHRLCGEMKIDATERQARKARQGAGRWSTGNPLTAMLKVA